MYSPITHQRITVASYLWTQHAKPPGLVKLKPGMPAPPATPAPSTRRPASARAAVGGGGGATAPAIEQRPRAIEQQRVKPRPPMPSEFVPAWPPTKATRRGGAHKPPALTLRSRSDSPTSFEQTAEAAGARLRLRWSDPLLSDDGEDAEVSARARQADGALHPEGPSEGRRMASGGPPDDHRMTTG